MSAFVPKSEEWFDLEVMMHHPDFPRTEYQRALRLFHEFAVVIMIAIGGAILTAFTFTR